MQMELNERLRNKQPLEAYLHFGAIERAREDNDTRPIPDAPWIVVWKKLTRRKDQIVYPHQPRPVSGTVTVTHRDTSVDQPPSPLEKQQLSQHLSSTDSNVAVLQELTEERETAYRWLRVLSWQAVFYLIVSDVLGIVTAPMTFRQLGYGPGVLVFTCFFILAFGSGQILWRLYMRLDSEQYPVTCYGDLGERTFGPWVRLIFNVLQSIQLVFNVGIIIVGDGQTLSALISDKFCYIGLNGFFALAGLLISQLKTLRSLAWFTNVNIWLNIIVMILTMIATGLFDPVPSQSGHKDLSEPIQRPGWTPKYNEGWYDSITGVQLAVFSYGGAMIFTEIMTEMRRPRDFWKAAFIGQSFVWLMYMTFGLVVFSLQGQYTNVLPMINFANIAFQAVTNFLSMLVISVTALLYGNIGCKVFYQNILREYCKAPPLTSKKGSLIWSLTVTGYWALAWLVGAAVPNLLALVTVVGATCTLQFTYTFPPLLLLGHWVQSDALKGDREWTPETQPYSNRVDSWRNASRWKRGLKPYWYAKLYLLLQFVGGLTLAGLGIYSGAMSAAQDYRDGTTQAFPCRAPAV